MTAANTLGESWTSKLVGAAATALAVFLLLYFPDRQDGSGAVLGALGAFLGVALVAGAIAKYRPLPTRSTSEHVRLVVFALGLGVALGMTNLLINYGLAELKPVIRDQMVTRWARFSPWSVVIAGPIMIGMAVKSGAAGLLLGWIFWRWGLPYSMVSHCAANGVHLLLMPLFFGVVV